MEELAGTLEGRFVRLEPLAEEHAAGLLQAGRAPEVWTWMPRGPLTDVADARALVAGLRARPGAVPFAIVERAGGRVAGSTSYLAVSAPDRRVEVGYTWLAPEHWRTALNTECKLLLLARAFEAWGANRVELKTDLRNERSQRAIERLGAVREGVLRRHMVVRDGAVRDTVYYSIVRDEWPAVRERLERALG